ncbi:MAG: Wzz/FepE/Etk N-terminal domain-containing protein [Desulfomonilia bacterium]|nr:Wzz/FepE/Etk N-terminal domain-containing protein [Desulfomonilia bacterium]
MNEENRQYYDDEIDLMEIFSILWSHKGLMIAVTAVIVILTGVITFTLPRIYRASVVIEPSIVSTTADSRIIHLDTAQNIRGKIMSNAYHQRIISALELEPEPAEIRFSTDIAANSTIIKVSYDVEADQIPQGIAILNRLVDELRADYEDEISRRKDALAKDVLMKQNQVQQLDIRRRDMEKQIAIKGKTITEKHAQIAIKQEAIRIYEQREKDLLQELKEVKDNTDAITRQRDAFLGESSTSGGSGLTELLYSTTIQQNVAFFNELRNQISDVKMRREQALAAIRTMEKEIGEILLEIERAMLEKDEQIQSQIDAIAIEIASLENQIATMRNLRMISEPSATTRPVKPRVVLNLALSVVIGLILAMFIAFIAHRRDTSRREAPETE